MTKFILHGGDTSTPNDLNKKFYAEVIKDLSEGSQILLVYFSKNEDEYNKLFAQDTEKIANSAGEKKFKTILASKENFQNKVNQSDVIYLRGGNTIKLLDALKQYPNFVNGIKDKTVAGSSAGAYVLSKYFFSPSEGGVFEGLGAVPVRINCHYGGSEKVVEELDKYPKNLDLVLLKDSETKVIFV
jgi:peptidase E